MAVLPAGTTVPPLAHLVVLAVGVAGVLVFLWRARPRVTERVVVAFAPWMGVGSALYVLYQLEALPAAVAPFAGSPAVYVSTFVLAGLVWAAAARYPADRWRLPSTPGVLAVAGGAVLVASTGAVVAVGVGRGPLRLFWPAAGFVVAVAVAATAWTAIRGGWPAAAEATGRAGALTVFGHALDGVSTAVGVDALGFGERTPLSRAIIDAAAGLPTAGLVGSGWLFVLVKVVLAAAVVYAFADYVEEEPRRGYLLLGLVAAVGLGPGVHNLLLFAVAG